MNPSTADGEANDPTVAREWGFTVREGYTGLVKCNVGDYRATSPKDVPAIGACTYDNLAMIAVSAVEADRVVVCFGKVPRSLGPAAGEVVMLLCELGIDLWCFGKNADGSPKHPLYLAATTPLVRF
jgi:hypothetical protein